MWVLCHSPRNSRYKKTETRNATPPITGRTLELPDRAPNLEAKLLKLTTAQFPFPCSLQTVVTSLYGGPQEPEQAMPEDELLRYLKGINQFELNPVEAVLAQTEAIGDPAIPSCEHTAKMEWVNMAFARWEEYFPLEPGLTQELRKLIPLGAALAITDPDFMTPGAHSFHKLLDTLQSGAIGWQASPAGAGRGLEKEVGKAINCGSEWAQHKTIDLAATLAKLESATLKDQGRAQRMAQRVVEAEQGKQKATRAKLRAANMINKLLEKYQAPTEIGAFIKGPWFESAQLLLLKYGAQSEQWGRMSTATDTLLDSLQPSDPPEAEEGKAESRRQRVFEAITRIPKELKHWLLSLQHDTEGVNRAITAIETAHMQVLRQQVLELESISPIAIRETLAPQENSEVQENIDKIEAGQWFLITATKKAPVRVQLALKIESDQQLLFTNHMGTKAMQQGYAYFVALLKGGQATLLGSGLSFSRCLAHAAEIRSEGDMTTLSGLIAERVAKEKAAQEKVDDQEARQLRKEYNDAVEAQRERDEAEQFLKERDETEGDTESESEGALDLDIELEPNSAVASEPESEGEFTSVDEVAAETNDAAQPEQSAPKKDPVENKQIDHLQHEKQLLEQREKALAEQEQAALLERQKSSKQESEVEVEGVIEYLEPQSEARPEDSNAPSLFDLEIPMGTWMGFHDGDKPLMAKLAAHDKKKDTYIFVNREGIKMRDLNKLELVSLMDSGSIDMLETSSNFRDEITRLRKKREE